MDPEYECKSDEGELETLMKKKCSIAFDAYGFADYMGDDVSDDDFSDGSGEDECVEASYDNLQERRRTVPTEEYIYKLQKSDITEVSNRFSIPKSSAIRFFRHYNWEVDKAKDTWLADEAKVRKDLGLLEKQEEVDVSIQNTENAIKCRNCLDEFPRDVMCAATTCGHLFCNSCWTQYVMKITDEPGCLMLECPDPSCAVAVCEDMVDKLVSNEDRRKYALYFYSSYDEDKKRTKQCPRQGCEFAVEFVVGSSSYDVVCHCGHSFCWNCVEDAHSPVDCDTVHKWNAKNTAESENIIWMFVNSKSCPKCKRPIQKNEGCLKMKCPCKHHFCWLCLGDWSTHGKETGGNYACNVYEKAKAKGRYDEEENIKKKAKDYLDRYTFFLEKFEEYEKSRLKAVESLEKIRSKYSTNISLTYDRLEAITDAWQQIIECRRVLKWTYVYGYYLPTTEKTKAQIFECLQGQAEAGLECLRRCAEVELQRYHNDIHSNYYVLSEERFNSFDRKLVDLTCVTRNYFQNLVRSLENGLSEVQS